MARVSARACAVTPLTLLALLLAPAIAWILYRTPLGLALRMVGENPRPPRARASM